MVINIGYAWRQLLGARRVAAEHEDEDVRARAVAKWEAVIAGMQAGTIDVGSRTPTQAPVWVTLEVVTGGFATGAYSAGGALTAHEHAVAERAGAPASRTAANLYYLEATEASELLASGCYRIDAPEEGALLVAAWLRERGEIEKAAHVVETIAPWFETLRFFPAPAATPVELRESVRLQDVRETADAIDVDQRQPAVEAQRVAELVWKPLRDRAIALWIETMEDGEPARVFPAGWRAWVHALVSECRAATAPKTKRAYEVIRLVELLARLATHPNALDASTLASVKNALARFVGAHGAPGTEAFVARRAADARAVAGPLHADLRRVLVDRLRREAPEGGLDLERVTAPVTEEEAGRFAVPAGSALPWYMIHKVARSWDAPLETLAAERVIPSAEEFARVLPQLTAYVRAQAIADDAGRRLYTAMYTAFRRRRGLLLLSYERQVRFHELPWVAAMESTRSADIAQVTRARRVVARATSAVMRAFPHTITPNKLVTELASLASAAKLQLPLVEELAADIFMGSFTPKFVDAAKISMQVLAGSLYVRYYGIDVHQIEKLAVTGKTADDFAALCLARADTGGGWGVARNGKVIEQCQILTTHNLGVLFDRLALDDTLAADLRALAERCFTWVVRQLRQPGDHRASLVRVKNAAYAWRQMVFYLSYLDAADFVAWMRLQLARTDDAFRARIEPAIRGLELAAGGVPSTSRAFTARGGRVFTGWATERHWLAAA